MARSRLSTWLIGAGIGLAAPLGWAVIANAGGVTPNATQPLIVHEIEYAYADPGTCENCHGNYDGQNDIEPFNLWSGSMMANAGRDPVFWAAVDVANNDIPGVGEFCLRCHAPKAWLEGRASAADVGGAEGCLLEGNLNQSSDGIDGNDFEGVTCHLCHRMMINPSPPPGELGNYTENAQFWIDDDDCTDKGTGPCRYGPYDYVPPDDTAPPHEWEYSEYHKQSQFCGTCHNVTSPANTLIDENGVDTLVPYPIERTFGEWMASDYGVDMGPSFQSCQDCHMPQVGVADAFACVLPFNDRTGDMAGHDFVGGNLWVPALIRDQYGSTINNGTGFDDTIARAGALLQSAAQVEITAPPEVGPGGNLNFDVRVTNLGGHKLPSGYNEGRRMWIHIEILEGDNDLIWESAAYNELSGVLDRDAQAKVYESRRGIWNSLGNNTCDFVNGSGVEEFHFVLDDCIALDNRIPPLGFTGGTNVEIQPVGYTYPETSPGSGLLVNYDDTSYVVPLPIDALPPLTVRATLRYQTSSKDYIEFLRDASVANDFPDDDLCISRSIEWDWPGDLDPGERSRGEFLFWLWDTGTKSAPFEMAVETSTVDIDSDIFTDGFESGDTTVWDATVGGN